MQRLTSVARSVLEYTHHEFIIIVIPCVGRNPVALIVVLVKLMLTMALPNHQTSRHVFPVA
jgi:hypothetical protein